MGGITLVENPSEPDGGFTLPNGLKTHLGSSHLDFNLLSVEGSSLSLANAASTNHDNQTSNGFSMSDFLVPGLQTKAWEDWQVADELNPFAVAADTQDYSSELISAPYMHGLDGMFGNSMWDTTALPASQAYDEFVFELSPSAFEPPTVNTVDLIAGPDAVHSVSPLDLAMPANYNNYEDLALANLYGFTEAETVFDSDSYSDLDDKDLSDPDSDSDDDSDSQSEDDDECLNGQFEQDMTVAVAMSLAMAATAPEVAPAQAVEEVAPSSPAEDANKRRMEEALVARIHNDLGPEHMAGLFKILKGSNDLDEEDEEEMEVDLSCLDESTLVQLYQYVESCCMETMRTLLAAEEQERQETEARRRHEEMMLARQKTPELSPGHSSSSSSCSPSPPRPLSHKISRSNGNKRSAATETACTAYDEQNDAEHANLWRSSQQKTKRKRLNGSSAGVGGGGTGKGVRIQRLASAEEALLSSGETVMDGQEDEEIDIMGL